MREIGRIEAAFKNAGLSERYNIWVTSDHGFSTYTGGVDVAAMSVRLLRSCPTARPALSRAAVRSTFATAIRE